MNPTRAPKPPGDSGRIVWRISVLTAGARERTRGCSPRAHLRGTNPDGRLMHAGNAVPPVVRGSDSGITAVFFWYYLSSLGLFLTRPFRTQHYYKKYF